MSEKHKVQLDAHSGGLVLTSGAKQAALHPLWLRERIIGTGDFDAKTHQRLYEHSELSPNLRITDFTISNANHLDIKFSDGKESLLNIMRIEHELGWVDNLENPPQPEAWDASLESWSGVEWHSLDDPDVMLSLLTQYFKNGFCILQNTPTERDDLKTLARRFGYLRETNFGEIFNVETKPDPSDLAYTDLALASHTDNPYRNPVPGIQFLHCLRNEVSGGLSTLVDGMAIAQQLAKESARQAQVLEEVIVRFRYQGPSGILEHYGPLIERGHEGHIRQVRVSSRLDYVPALDHDTLDLFYAGRRRLHEMANDTTYRISFPFKRGTLLMMDNYRLLHGRTAFNGKQGHRHLQGGYIDHDGPASLYRMLKRGDTRTWTQREA